jgi:hypothetical protein
MVVVGKDLSNSKQHPGSGEASSAGADHDAWCGQLRANRAACSSISPVLCQATPAPEPARGDDSTNSSLSTNLTLAVMAELHNSGERSHLSCEGGKVTNNDVMMLTAGSRSLVDALLNRDTVLADFPRSEELAAAGEWSSVSLYSDLCAYIEERLGTYAFLRLGRKVGIGVMDVAFPPGITSVEGAIAAIDKAHQHFCRPVVGAFDLSERAPGKLTLRYTAPYNCVIQEGLFYEVAIRYGAANASVVHAECRRKGAAACLFEIRY